MADLSHVDYWVFDLDNTIYPAECNLFAQVDVRIGEYIARTLDLPHDKARHMQKGFFRQYGTTMQGLMEEYGIDPHHFMNYVHDIDYSQLPDSTDLDEALKRLEGPKYIFTNGSVKHAEAVLQQLGVAARFADIFDIAAANFHPKPQEPFYDLFLDRHGMDPAATVLIEDMAINLKPAHDRGMTTVHVHTSSDWAMNGHDADYVHHSTDNLIAFLNRVSA
ncbi:MAG: pyrimidine 5'-nucleotidase [Rhodospirillaceae bacterium]|nr:pyrimidine 5'-nucleotidase [Rhodospirillaceae bacterium]MCY4238730.1 pyrimidine 5'-nucleotidase [Rhodospirillaceae bacterium]